MDRLLRTTEMTRFPGFSYGVLHKAWRIQFGGSCGKINGSDSKKSSGFYRRRYCCACRAVYRRRRRCFALPSGDKTDGEQALSQEVLAYAGVIQAYAQQYGIEEFYGAIQAIMMQGLQERETTYAVLIISS